MKPIVMLVDDEVGFVETITKRLEKRNLQLLKAYSGEEALEILKRNMNTDVVILDVKMPGMDGIETLMALKKSYPLVEVIMLTGHGTIESAIDGMKLGAFDYLLKPCDMGKLMEKLEAATKRKQEQEEKIKEAKVKEAISSHG